MAILLGYTTALAYWRSCAQTTDSLMHKALLGNSDERRNATTSFTSKQHHPRTRQLYLDYLADDPAAHVILLNQQIRPRHHGSTRHTFTRLPAYSCMYTNRYFAGERLFVSTPEYCFLQMASLLSLERLIELGYELCGTYSLQSAASVFGQGPSSAASATSLACADSVMSNEHATHANYNSFPLTTPEKIGAFLERSSGIKGVRMARRALRYILPASASPMESKLTMMLCLPYSLGGYGIEMPSLNHRIDLPKNLKKRFGHSYFKCDLYWPCAQLAVEYDSDLAHSGINKTMSDIARRNALEALDVTVLSVTRLQVYRANAFNKLAHVVAEKTGKRLQYVDPGFTRKHRRLRDLLLFAQDPA